MKKAILWIVGLIVLLILLSVVFAKTQCIAIPILAFAGIFGYVLIKFFKDSGGNGVQGQ